MESPGRAVDDRAVSRGEAVRILTADTPGPRRIERSMPERWVVRERRVEDSRRPIDIERAHRRGRGIRTPR